VSTTVRRAGSRLSRQTPLSPDPTYFFMLMPAVTGAIVGSLTVTE
jgi:hypothetical protein